ncbi:transcriptional regulator domain-containing protein [Komagataeibacter oboediens]|uniref:transcriptional regulator domain-containing protein n=1 Tax=Komagataeibacter oboediens TaxID=65958 RepID=UPI001C2D5CE0|nr:DUF6499 domain-containing protein [Komagataeibacter oboediens]MBV1825310.1 hypothetical protein [Komagataeibacter oboediens]
MSRANWRSAGAYESLRSLNAPAFALQFLCRNSDFQHDRRRLQLATQAGTLHPDEAEAFARHWGLRFRPCGSCGSAVICGLDGARVSGRDGSDHDAGGPD